MQRRRTRLLFVGLLSLLQIAVVLSSSSSSVPFVRGGSTTRIHRAEEEDAFALLSRYVSHSKLLTDKSVSPEKIRKTLTRLSQSQQALKGLDGAAHEAYQRTHSDESDIEAKQGRAQRSAARVAVTAQALLACELCEYVESLTANGEQASSDEMMIPAEEDEQNSGSLLNGRQVLLNLTTIEDGDDECIPLGSSSSKLSVLVLLEPDYCGGSGLDHGTIDSLAAQLPTTGRRRQKPIGRLLVILADELRHDLVSTLEILQQKPMRVKLASGLVSEEVASLQASLYQSAGRVLEQVEPLLRQYSNTTAIHFVGRSLAGGVASIAATILDGSIPMPGAGTKSRTNRKRRGSRPTTTAASVDDDSSGPVGDDCSNPLANATVVEEEQPLNGLGRARSSAVSIGGPPCLSSNVLAAFCTSILYGDDVVCRATQDSITRLCSRIEKSLKAGVVGRKLGWMSDTVSMTVSSLQNHAHGSEGEEMRLAIPGSAYLIRPRRLHGICSIHEVGNIKGGREALRAGLLWQLNDVLLSKSIWKHHDLTSYIQGLDRIQLRGTNEDDLE